MSEQVDLPQGVVAGQASSQFMISKLVEIDSDGLTVAYDLPSG